MRCEEEDTQPGISHMEGADTCRVTPEDGFQVVYFLYNTVSVVAEIYAQNNSE